MQTLLTFESGNDSKDKVNHNEQLRNLISAQRNTNKKGFNYAQDEQMVKI